MYSKLLVIISIARTLLCQGMLPICNIFRVSSRRCSVLAFVSHHHNSKICKSFHQTSSYSLFSSKVDDSIEDIKSSSSCITNVAIIGGGLAGLSTAYHLLEISSKPMHIPIFDKEKAMRLTQPKPMQHTYSHANSSMIYLFCKYVRLVMFQTRHSATTQLYKTYSRSWYNI